MSEGGRRVLGVGVATLDIINEVAAWPTEDAEVRALAQRVTRGGNATNTLVVLSQLGHACAWAGSLADDAASAVVLAELHGHGVDTALSVRYAGASTPTSYVALSRATGSRTIIHYRDLPELSADDFSRVDLDPFDWVHFEGRDPAATGMMLAQCRRRRPELPISLEVEKPRPGIEALLQGPELLIFARAYAQALGYREPEPFLLAMREQTPSPWLILAWGSAGAYALGRDGQLSQAPGHPPRAVVDSLGAGDVFNAAVIDGRLAGLALGEVIGRAARLAGFKCGRRGLDGLVAAACVEGIW